MRSRLFIIIIIVIIVAGAGAAVYFFYFNGGEQASNQNNAPANANAANTVPANNSAPLNSQAINQAINLATNTEETPTPDQSQAILNVYGYEFTVADIQPYLVVPEAEGGFSTVDALLALSEIGVNRKITSMLGQEAPEPTWEQLESPILDPYLDDGTTAEQAKQALLAKENNKLTWEQYVIVAGGEYLYYLHKAEELIGDTPVQDSEFDAVLKRHVDSIYAAITKAVKYSDDSLDYCCGWFQEKVESARGIERDEWADLPESFRAQLLNLQNRLELTDIIADGGYYYFGMMVDVRLEDEPIEDSFAFTYDGGKFPLTAKDGFYPTYAYIQALLEQGIEDGSIVLTDQDVLELPPIKQIVDADEDGLTDTIETMLETDPDDPDTDGDGYDDKTELDAGFSPLK